MKSQRMHTWVSVDGQRTGGYTEVFGRTRYAADEKPKLPPRAYARWQDEQRTIYSGHPELQTKT